MTPVFLASDIGRSYEKYVTLIDVFYGDDVEAASEGCLKPVVGKTSLKTLMTSRLLPLQVMAEIGGPSVTAPTRRGFGTSLIKATFADVRLDFARAGLACEIAVPLGRTDEAGAELGNIP